MNDNQRRADTAPYWSFAVGRFAKLLPQTNSRLLRVVVVGLVMACLWFAVACE